MQITKTTAALAVAIIVAVIALVVTIGSVAGLKSSAAAQSSKDQASISQLTAANKQLQSDDKQLAAEVAQGQAKLAGLKIPGATNTTELGVCVSQDSTTDSVTGDLNSDFVSIISPSITNGVVSCAGGGQFVPVTPGNNQTNSN